MTGIPVVGPPYSKAVHPPKVRLSGFGKGKTKQSELQQADVNWIVAKYDKTGVIPVSKRQAFYADVSTIGDYRSVMERVQEAAEFFMQQPASLREEFENDPAKFLDYVSTATPDQLREKGLLEAEGEEPPVELPVEPAPAPPAVEGSEIPAPQ